jgi:hypothetical protein
MHSPLGEKKTPMAWCVRVASDLCPFAVRNPCLFCVLLYCICMSILGYIIVFAIVSHTSSR